MQRYLLLMNTLITANIALAQEGGRIAVVVNNESRAPMENVTVELLRTKDSLLVKTALTDRNGRAEFDRLSFDSYFLRTSAVGYLTNNSAIISLNAGSPSTEIPGIQLEATATKMQAVT